MSQVLQTTCAAHSTQTSRPRATLRRHIEVASNCRTCGKMFATHIRFASECSTLVRRHIELADECSTLAAAHIGHSGACSTLVHAHIGLACDDPPPTSDWRAHRQRHIGHAHDELRYIFCSSTHLRLSQLDSHRMLDCFILPLLLFGKDSG